MDAGYEEKIYRQIEKNLSDNINDKLYVPIELIDKSAYSSRNNVTKSLSDKNNNIYKDFQNRNNQVTDFENRDSNYDWPGNQAEYDRLQEDKPVLSRAEYIRLAREACLRQLYSAESSAGSGDNYAGQDEIYNPFFGKKRKEKVAKLFQDGTEDVLPDEIASYKSLIIRTVCALVIFLSIFIIDKVKLKWGNFSYETIRHYVTGYNQLDEIEEKIVSWLK